MITLRSRHSQTSPNFSGVQIFFLVAIDERTICVGVARVGCDSQKIVAGTLEQMTSVDLGGPLHSLVIAADNLHPLEIDMLKLYADDPSIFSTEKS